MSLEPLADYLKPQFGNIYDYNLEYYDVPGIEVQEWTDDLRVAVEQYLFTEVDDDRFVALYKSLLGKRPYGDRSKQIKMIIDRVEAWQIAHTLHLIAVVAVPTLDELIGSRSAWSGDSLQDDVAEWLDRHASPEQLHKIAEITGHPELGPVTPWYKLEPIGEYFTRALEPTNLLTAWNWARGIT